MGANLPGQSPRWCGQATQVAACGSHSAGMRKPSVAGGGVVMTPPGSAVAFGAGTFYDGRGHVASHPLNRMTDLLTTTLPCFRPLPLLRNPHLQTVLGLYLKGGRFRGPSVERLVPLPDGDQLVLHDTTPAEWRPGRPVAVILHGLTGSASSSAVVSMARMFLRR